MLKTLVLILGIVGSYSWACPIINGTFKSSESGMLVDVSSSVDAKQIVTYTVESPTFSKTAYIADGVKRVPLGVGEFTSYVTATCPGGDLVIDLDVRLTKDQSPFWHFVETYSPDTVGGFSYHLVSDMLQENGTWYHEDRTVPYSKASK